MSETGEQFTKICPFMSLSRNAYCQESRCMAWESHKPVDEYDLYVGGHCRLIP